MKVIDLIIQLQKLPSDLDVMFYADKDDVGNYILIEIDGLEEVKTVPGKKYAVLFCASGDDIDPSLN